MTERHTHARGRAPAADKAASGGSARVTSSARPHRSLQDTIGNRGVLHLLRREVAAALPPIAAPDSAAEREASSVARGDAPSPSSQLTAAAPSGAVPPVPGSSGRPVAPELRRDVEERLGADLSSVRVHDDPAAHLFAHSVGARAVTLGSNVYFGAGRFAPSTAEGREVLHHELVHTLQPDASRALHRTPENEARLREIDQQLASAVINDDYRAQLERERADIAGRDATAAAAVPAPFNFNLDLGGGIMPQLFPLGGEPISVVTMSDAEYEAMTGLSASALPEGTLPGAPTLQGNDAGTGLAQPSSSGSLPSMLPSAGAGSVGVGSMFVQQPNWYYRVLQPTDPSLANILRGAELVPRQPTPPNVFVPEPNPALMTFRHMRPGGNVLQVGTDRISTAADLLAFQRGPLAGGRGAELVRIDVDAARRLGAQFLERGDIMAHLDEVGRGIRAELDAARAAGRGKNAIARIESRLRALEAARDYARTFQEGHGVGSIPSRAVSGVKGPTLGEAAAAEQAFLGRLRFFRYGGRVLLVVGAAMSVERVVSAPEDQRARVATQEAGGWAFSWAGAAAGTKAGAAVGAALGFETGPGAVIAAAIGALIGAAIGFVGGERAADAIYDVGEGAMEGLRTMSNPATFLETTNLMFGTPESRRAFYEMRELEGGEPAPDDLF